MGGGLAAGLTYCSATAECREARAFNLPDAERLCANGSGRGGGSGRYGASGVTHHGSDRGGFGHTAAAHASSGG